MADLRECPQCGIIRGKAGQGWSGNNKKQCYRCNNKDCSMYGKKTMQVKQYTKKSPRKREGEGT